jgi:hypothetical protein
MIIKSLALAAVTALSLATGSAQAATAPLGIGAPATEATDSNATQARWVCGYFGCRWIPSYGYNCYTTYVYQYRYNYYYGVWQYVYVPVTRCY